VVCAMNSASFSLCINKVSIFFFQSSNFEIWVLHLFYVFFFFVFFFFLLTLVRKRERSREWRKRDVEIIPISSWCLFLICWYYDTWPLPLSFFSFFSPLFYEATHYKSSFFPLLLAKLFFKKTCFFFYFEKTEKWLGLLNIREC
jgi:amino acid transporter